MQKVTLKTAALLLAVALCGMLFAGCGDKSADDLTLPVVFDEAVEVNGLKMSVPSAWSRMDNTAEDEAVWYVGEAPDNLVAHLTVVFDDHTTYHDTADEIADFMRDTKETNLNDHLSAIGVEPNDPGVEVVDRQILGRPGYILYSPVRRFVPAEKYSATAFFVFNHYMVYTIIRLPAGNEADVKTAMNDFLEQMETHSENFR